MDIEKYWRHTKSIICLFIISLISIISALVFIPVTDIECSKSNSSCKITSNLFFRKSFSITSNTDISVKRKQLFQNKNHMTLYTLQIGTLNINYDIEEYSALKSTAELNKYIH